MPWLRGLRAALLALVCVGGALPPALVAAQAAQTGQRATAGVRVQPGTERILMLRPAGVASPTIASAVADALEHTLAEIGFAVTRSQLPLHDAQLVAGCTGTLRECGSQVAKSLDSEHLAVARLEQPAAAGAVRLELFVFESGGVLREGAGDLPQASLEPSLRALVQRVFGAPSSAPDVAKPYFEVVASPARMEERRPRLLRSFGWVGVGAGGALLVGALATSLSAQNASRAYARSEVDSREDADRALGHYDSAQHRAEIANVLWGVGAASAAAGAFMLLWQRLASPVDRDLQPVDRDLQQKTALAGRMRVSATPAPAGVGLALRGEL